MFEPQKFYCISIIFIEAEDDFDWGAYLLEGIERYVPSDEDSSVSYEIFLSYDNAVIQWITSCHKYHMTVTIKACSVDIGHKIR